MLQNSELECIRSPEAPIVPAEIGHRPCSTRLVPYCYEGPAELRWGLVRERFYDDEEADSTLSRLLRLFFVMSE